MTASKQGEPLSEEFWREFLIKGSPLERASRRVFGRIPHGPRCRMCGAPFEGPGAPVMRLIGKRRSEQTPHWCMSCFTFMSHHHGGAEIELTFLFADVRGSTPLAERMESASYRQLMSRFYETAAEVVFHHDGAIDKFVGDEVVAFFIPALAGGRHAASGVETAQALLRATGHADPDGPWLPLGAGVHTGLAWIGTVRAGSRTEFTALGDAVNTASRLASAAKAGEIVVSTDAATAAGLDPGMEHRRLELKGKEGTTEVVTLTVASDR